MKLNITIVGTINKLGIIAQTMPVPIVGHILLAAVLLIIMNIEKKQQELVALIKHELSKGNQFHKPSSFWHSL